jgi:glycerate 2-kinase
VKPSWRDRQTVVAKLVRAAIAAANPYAAVKKNLELKGNLLKAGNESRHLSQGARIFAVGAGKAGAAMALAVEEIAGKRLAGGVVAVSELPVHQPNRIRLIRAGHPVPDEGSVLATREIFELLREMRPEDVVLGLISGGGSALLELPAQPLTLEDLQRTTKLLLRIGATIQETNIVRKELSQVKGGGLARRAAPASVINLILSDVIGDPLDVIASGPTVPKHTTAADALAVVRHYGLMAAVPDRVLEHLDRMSGVSLGESRPIYPPIQNVVVGNNSVAAEAVCRRARQLGFNTLFIASPLEGEARDVGAAVATLAKSVRARSDPIHAPACLVRGGETTVTVTGRGRGGRNQELALAASIALEGTDGSLVLALATDGVDGPTPAAGAYGTGETIARCWALGLDPSNALRENDSFTLFHALGQTLDVGPTGTNVCDIVVVLVYGR